MKKFMALAFTGIFLTLIASCGSSKAHCEAYGDATTIIEDSDLAENN